MVELARKQPMAEHEIVAILEAEENDSVGYYRSEIAEAQEESLDYYLGQPFGDEVEGRSQVISLDVRETVEWTIPDLRRIFMQGDLFSVEADSEQAVEHADQACEYLNHVFFRDNPGFKIWQGWAKDGLIQKIGIARVDWEEPGWKRPQEYKNLSTVELMVIMQEVEAERAEILEHEEVECEVSEQYPDGVCHDVKVREKEKYGKPVISGIAPEEFLIKRASTDIETAGYKAHVYYRTVGSLIEEYPDMRQQLEEELPADDDENLETRKQSRFWDEDYRPETTETPIDFASRKVRFLDEYIMVDYDGDGIPELRNVRRVGRLVLRNEEVDEDPFWDWCPISVPHKFYGLSQADEVMPLQRAKSVVWRAANDSLYQSVAPRNLVRDGHVNMNDLLTVQAGVNIRVDSTWSGPLQDAVAPLMVPDVTPSAYQMLDYMDKELEGRTGVSRYNQGMDPDSLNKTATGIQLIQNASNSRKEMIAANMAIGLEKLGAKMLRMLQRYEHAARIIKIRDGKFTPMDPANWSHDMSVKVHVGLGTGSREAQMSILANIIGRQEQILMQTGGDAPVVGWEHYYNALEQYTHIAGYAAAGQFWRDPKGYEPPEPQPDPEIEKEQIKAQTKAQEIQAKQEMGQAELAVKTQNDQQEQLAKARLSEIEIESKERIAAAELDLKERMAAAELDLKERMFQMELEMKERLGQMERAQKASEMALSTDVQMGGEPG